MSNKRYKKGGRKPERRISVRAVRRDPPDLTKLSRALIALAMAEAAAQADDEENQDKQNRDEKRSA